MNKNHTSIALVLDRSGSMASCLESTIKAANSFLADQASAPGSADFTLTLFDNVIEQPHLAVPIAEIPEFNTTNFVPRGCTALLDAIGSTIKKLGQRLASLPEKDRPGTVIVAILTDGLENASERFDWKEINRMILHQQEKYSWQFLFLGAGEDAIAQAAQIGISHSNASAFANDSHGYYSSTAALTRKARAYRSASAGTLSEAEKADLHEDLDKLVKEEDTKSRHS